MKTFLILILFTIIFCKIEKFRIIIKEETLIDLKERLNKAIFPTPIQNKTDNWEHGTDINYLKEIVTYWKNEYNWRKMEEKLNQFDHYKTRINNLDIHFIHMKAKVKTDNTLLMVHGWPGSFFEFYKIIPLFLNSKEHPFNVVVPSLPGKNIYSL